MSVHQPTTSTAATTTALDSEKHTGSFSDLQDLTRALSNDTDDDDEEEDEEFGGSGLKDEPNQSFLQAMETEIDDLAQTISKIPPVTPSQLQAHLAVGLDKEKHDDLADLSIHQPSVDTIDIMDQSTDDEFGCAQEDDQAVEQYLETSMTNVHAEPPPPPPPSQATSLDREKHDELGPTLLYDTPNAAALDVSDQPEFGYAHANDPAVDDYLQKSQDAIRREQDRHGASPRRLMVTPSQLQARIPAALDDDKHEEIGGLMVAKLDPNNDEDEFEEADMGDQAVQQYLQKSRESIHRQNGAMGGGGGLQVTPSQLQALIASALDDEKHEEMGDLMTPAGLMRVADGDHAEDEDDDDEFGGAAADDRPVNQYLQRARISMMEDFTDDELNDLHDIDDDEDGDDNAIGPTSTKLSSGQQATKGLDGEQHDEIGELMQSPKPRSLSMDTTDDDGDDEFGSAGASDLPVDHYLRQNQESVDEDDDTTGRLRPPPKVTKSQLQALIPSGLDGEEHQDISALLAQSRHGNLDDHDDDWNEFGDATTADTPVHKYLRRSSESLPLVSDDADEADNVDPIRRRQKLLAKAKKALLMEDGRNVTMVESLEEEADMDDDIVEYEELKGGSFSQLVAVPSLPSDYTNKKWLDTDRHEDLGDLRKSHHSDDEDENNGDRNANRDDDDAGDDEFGHAGENDAPVQTYLMAQNSMHDRSYDLDDETEELPVVAGAATTPTTTSAASETSVQQQ